MEILDTGHRKEFESGAVRDCADGRGRCDLLPLDVLAMYFNQQIVDTNANKAKAVVADVICNELHHIVHDHDANYVQRINRCINAFISREYADNVGEAFMELSKHYENGAIKYAERNWEKGIPTHCYVDSTIRHLLKWYDGWTDEPHNRAILWNLCGLMWTLINKPEFDDLPKDFKKVLDN